MKTNQAIQVVRKESRPELDTEPVAAGLAALSRFIVDLVDYCRRPSSGEGDRIIPLTDWPKFHPWPTVSGLRKYVADAHRNGFSKVMSRSGTKILINEQAFMEWARGKK